MELEEYAQACEAQAAYEVSLGNMGSIFADDYSKFAAMLLTAANLARGVYRG